VDAASKATTPAAEERAHAAAKDELSPVPASSAEARPARALDRGEDSPDGWQALARAGEYKQAYRRVSSSFESECERLDAERLQLLADVARFGGSSERALGALGALRRRFPGGPAAGAAAFAIARIHFDQRAAYAEAARWFRTYLKEQPRGSLAREAQGRRMEALVRLGDRAEARKLAERYLAQHPNGPHARLARSLSER
jgi:tetratricopeptide (TPR) repeat protein